VKIRSIASAFALIPAIAIAEAPPVTGNGAFVSDYRFRGISQTYLGPAIQGGIDYAHASGVYFGNWNSSVSGLVFTGGSGIEMDFYGGVKKNFGDIGFDAGAIYYWYPKAKVAGDDFNNLEIYVGASWRFISGKLFYALDDYFGVNSTQAINYWARRDDGSPLRDRGSSKGTTYLDLNANIPLTGPLGLVAHYGILSMKKYDELDYQDWKLGVTYDLQGWVLGAAYVDTSADPLWYYTSGSVGPKDSGRAGFVLSVTKTF
jgi:uncharacterized protein (TIGR02001 family)